MKIENKFLLKGDKKECNGCGICTKICPKNCIEMKEDSEGFLYPIIDENRCIHCNKCKNICSNINPPNKYKGETYAAINKSEEERKNSASGGMFYLLAKNIIEKNGVVFGVEYTKKLRVQHSFAENLEDCKKFQDSKYVRSDLNNSFEKAKEFLENDRWVLFTGTSCQVHALKLFLGKDYEKLILCDIICHANPSPKIFKMYLENIEKKYNKEIEKISFRTKENGWKNQTPIIQFIDGSKIEESTFLKAFICELINRPSCHACKFASFNRQSDITIGDFWKVDKVFGNSEMDDDKGTSLILINTEKGKKIFDEIKENMKLKRTTKELGLGNNRHENKPLHVNRQKFFKKVAKNKINEDNVLKMLEKYRKLNICQRIMRKIKFILK